MFNFEGLNGNGVKALEIYNLLLHNSKLIPDERTYSNILNACSHSILAHEAEQIFNFIPTKCRNVFVYATMVCRIFVYHLLQNLLYFLID